MISIEDLPDEILVLIFKELDYFSLYNLSHASKAFEKFYTDSQIVRRVDVKPQYSIDNAWALFKPFLTICKTNITHLNISHVNWIKKPDFLRVVKSMMFLQYLNVIDTGIFLAQLENIINGISTLKSVAVSFDGKQLLTKYSIALDDLHVALDINFIRQFIWATQVRRCFSKINVKVEVTNSTYFASCLTNLLPAIFSTVIFKTICIPKISMLKCEVEEILRVVDTSLYIYVVIETTIGIFLSDNLCPDLVDNIFIKRFKSPERYAQTYLMSMFGASVHCQDSSAAEKFLYERLNIRMNKMGIPPDTGCFLSKTEPVIQHLMKSTCYRQLILSPLQLMTYPVTQPNEPLFKKLRTLRDYQPEKIQPKRETTIFEDILANNKEVVSLNVHQQKFLTSSISHGTPACCGNIHNRIAYSMDSLQNIVGLKHLKHLCMTEFPSNCHEFAKQLYINCDHLESLQAGSLLFHRIEPFAEHIHYSKSIKIIDLKTCMRQIDFVIKKLSQAPNLHTVAITDNRNLTKQNYKVSLEVLLQIIEKCKKLVYLYLYQEDMSSILKKHYRKLEKACQSKSEKLTIKLTEPYAFVLYDDEHYDISFPDLSGCHADRIGCAATH